MTLLEAPILCATDFLHATERVNWQCELKPDCSLTISLGHCSKSFDWSGDDPLSMSNWLHFPLPSLHNEISPSMRIQLMAPRLWLSQLGNGQVALSLLSQLLLEMFTLSVFFLDTADALNLVLFLSCILLDSSNRFSPCLRLGACPLPWHRLHFPSCRLPICVCICLCQSRMFHDYGLLPATSALVLRQLAFVPRWFTMTIFFTQRVKYTRVWLVCFQR